MRVEVRGVRASGFQERLPLKGLGDSRAPAEVEASAHNNAFHAAMESPSTDSPLVPSAEIKPYTTIHELDSVTDEPEVQNDELDETAPNWAFASFVAERDELLALFTHLNPVENSQRITIIVRTYHYSPLQPWKLRFFACLRVPFLLPHFLSSNVLHCPFIGSKVSRATSITGPASGIHDKHAIRCYSTLFEWN